MKKMTPYLICTGFIVFSPFVFAAESGHQTDIVDKIFLAWPPKGLVAVCSVKLNTSNVVITPGTLEPGEPIILIAPSGETQSGHYVRTLENQECQGLSVFSSAGLVQLNSDLKPEMGDENISVAQMADVDKDRIGTVKEIPSDPDIDLAINRIPSEGEKIYSKHIDEISVPQRKNKLILVITQRDNVQRHESDKTGNYASMKIESFVWSKNKLIPTPGIAISHVFTATDLDGDGVLELVVTLDGGYYSGQESVLKFDGDKFSTTGRTLYSWED